MWIRSDPTTIRSSRSGKAQVLIILRWWLVMTMCLATSIQKSYFPRLLAVPTTSKLPHTREKLAILSSQILEAIYNFIFKLRGCPQYLLGMGLHRRTLCRACDERLQHHSAALLPN